MKPNNYDDFFQNGCIFALDANRLLVGWGEWSKSATVPKRGSNNEVCSLYTPDFYMTDREPWRSPRQFEVMTREFFTSNVLPPLRSEVKGFRWVEPLSEVFENQARVIREAFKNNGLLKAVPVVHAQACEIMTQDRLIAILSALVCAPLSLVPYGFWESGVENKLVEGLLGATPETLFSIEKRGEGTELSTMALAGTRAKLESGDAQELFNDPKERHEHQIVVDDLVQRLSRWGEVSLSETHVTELPTLFHLKTRLTVSLSSELASADALQEIVTELHPTPALGIAPRSFGFQNMNRWDQVSLRGRYGAPFGLRLKTHGNDIQDCLVAIRNVQWNESAVPTLGSGCGFVPESVDEKEWAELKLKRESVKKVLQI